MAIADSVQNLAGWPFLQEPVWRWFIFIGAMLMMMFVWHGILDFMK